MGTMTEQEKGRGEPLVRKSRQIHGLDRKWASLGNVVITKEHIHGRITRV